MLCCSERAHCTRTRWWRYTFLMFRSLHGRFALIFVCVRRHAFYFVHGRPHPRPSATNSNMALKNSRSIGFLVTHAHIWTLDSIDHIIILLLLRCSWSPTINVRDRHSLPNIDQISNSNLFRRTTTIYCNEKHSDSHTKIVIIELNGAWKTNIHSQKQIEKKNWNICVHHDQIRFPFHYNWNTSICGASTTMTMITLCIAWIIIFFFDVAIFFLLFRVAPTWQSGSSRCACIFDAWWRVCVCVALESGTISHRRSNGINCFIIKLMKHIGKVYGQPMIDSYVEYACARAPLDESVWCNSICATIRLKCRDKMKKENENT